MKVDADDPKETASLETMPPEVLGQIWDELSPNVSAFRLLNKRFAAIGRPYLADRHYRLYLNPTSVARLDGFADDDEWKQRLWELTYRVGDRANPTLPALTGPQYRALEDDMDDNFTDDVHKLARYICYVDWRAEQHDELTQNSTDLEVFVRVRSLPNLEKANVGGFSCLNRPLFIPRIEQTLQFPVVEASGRSLPGEAMFYPDVPKPQKDLSPWSVSKLKLLRHNQIINILLMFSCNHDGETDWYGLALVKSVQVDGAYERVGIIKGQF